MKYISYYNSILGKITLISDGKFLTNLYFNLKNDESNFIEKDLPIFTITKHWLDLYFQGNIPSFTPEYKLNVTKFQNQVLDIVKNIPYGKVITYKDITKEIAKNNNLKKMSSQAVGQAVSKNPICIIIPCHRVIGQNNNLVGYTGGLKNKIALLQIEKHDITKFKVPKNAKM